MKRSSLQSQATIISNNLVTVSEHLTDQQDLFGSLIAYPGPDYPSRTQGPALEQLLRTKLDPRVEDWVSRGRTVGQKSQSQAQALVGGQELSEGDLTELWEWAPVEANQEARGRNWGGNFTLEEKEAGIENVVTGLRRELEDDDESEEEEEEEEEEEDQMDIVGARKKASGGGLEFDIAARQPAQVAAGEPVMPLDDVLRFMTTGLPPKQR